jgi:hypothetical protein
MSAPNIEYVRAKLAWMRDGRIWPNGLRYLWTDAFGLLRLVSLHRRLGEAHYLDEAEWLVSEVERVLGRPRGIRIGEAPDRDGQYFHYLAMWLFALARFGALEADYRRRGIALARDIHRAFVIPGTEVIWKMKEDLIGPYAGFGLGALDAFDGYVSYRLLDEEVLAPEIGEMRDLIARNQAALSLCSGSAISSRKNHGRKSRSRARSPCSTACGSIRPATSAALHCCRTPNSLSPTTACRSGCKRCSAGLIAPRASK